MKQFPRISAVAMAAAVLACNAGSFDSGDQTSKGKDSQAGTGGVSAASTPDDAPGLLGTVQRITDIVEHGPTVETIEQVVDEVSLFAGDVLRVRDGGEGLLVFPDGMLLRLFNDTALNITVVESDPGTPIDVRMFLEDGGFTGELTAAGGSAVFETPGGAEVLVLGADFFVTYDPMARQTVAGNFGGEVEVSGAGESVMLADGEFVEVPDGGPPGQPLPMTVDRESFEEMARAESSPIAAAKGASRWRLTIVHHVETPNEIIGDNNVHDWVWEGDFTLSDGQLTGSGQTTIGGNVPCTEPPPSHAPVSGSFDFEILGSVVDGPEGPQFDLDLPGSSVAYSESPDCVIFVGAIVELYDTLSTDVESVSEPIVVAASDGAAASIPFTAETPPYWYGGPLEVTVGALP